MPKTTEAVISKTEKELQALIPIQPAIPPARQIAPELDRALAAITAAERDVSALQNTRVASESKLMSFGQAATRVSDNISPLGDALKALGHERIDDTKDTYAANTSSILKKLDEAQEKLNRAKTEEDRDRHGDALKLFDEAKKDIEKCRQDYELLLGMRDMLRMAKAENKPELSDAIHTALLLIAQGSEEKDKNKYDRGMAIADAAMLLSHRSRMVEGDANKETRAALEGAMMTLASPKSDKDAISKAGDFVRACDMAAVSDMGRVADTMEATRLEIARLLADPSLAALAPQARALLTDIRNMQERLRDPARATTEISDEEIGALARRSLELQRMTSDLAGIDNPEMRRKIGGTYAAGLDTLSAGDMGGHSLLVFAAGELRKAEGKYAIDLMAAVDAVAKAADAAQRNAAELKLVSVISGSLSKRLEEAAKAKSAEASAALTAIAAETGAFAKKPESATPEALMRAEAALDVAKSMSDKLNSQWRSQNPEAARTAESIYTRALQELQGREGNPGVAMTHTLLAERYVESKDTAQRNDIYRLEIGLARAGDDKTRKQALGIIKEWTDLDSSVAQLRAQAGARTLPQGAKQNMLSIVQEAEAMQRNLAATGQLASDQQVQKDIAAVERRMSGDDAFKKSVSDFAAQTGLGQEAAVALIAKQERRDALLQLGAAIPGIYASIPHDAVAGATELLGFALDALRSGDHGAADDYANAAATYARLARTSDRQGLLDTFHQLHEKKTDAEQAAMILSIYTARVASQKSITDRGLLTNVEAYQDLALIAARRGDLAGANFILSTSAMYARWNANPETFLSPDLLEQKRKAVAFVYENLGDYRQDKQMMGGKRLIDAGTGPRGWSPAEGSISAPLSAAVMSGKSVQEAVGGAERFIDMQISMTAHGIGAADAKFVNDSASALGATDAALKKNETWWKLGQQRLQAKEATARRSGNSEAADYFNLHAQAADFGFAQGAINAARELRLQGSSEMHRALDIRKEADIAALEAKRAGAEADALGKSAKPQDKAKADEARKKAGEATEKAKELTTQAQGLAKKALERHAAADKVLEGVRSLNTGVRLTTKHAENGWVEANSGIRSVCAASGALLRADAEAAEAAEKAKVTKAPRAEEKAQLAKTAEVKEKTRLTDAADRVDNFNGARKPLAFGSDSYIDRFGMMRVRKPGEAAGAAEDIVLERKDAQALLQIGSNAVTVASRRVQEQQNIQHTIGSMETQAKEVKAKYVEDAGKKINNLLVQLKNKDEKAYRKFLEENGVVLTESGTGPVPQLPNDPAKLYFLYNALCSTLGIKWHDDIEGKGEGDKPLLLDGNELNSRYNSLRGTIYSENFRAASAEMGNLNAEVTYRNHLANVPIVTKELDDGHQRAIGKKPAPLTGTTLAEEVIANIDDEAERVKLRTELEHARDIGPGAVEGFNEDLQRSRGTLYERVSRGEMTHFDPHGSYRGAVTAYRLHRQGNESAAMDLDAINEHDMSQGASKERENNTRLEARGKKFDALSEAAKAWDRFRPADIDSATWMEMPDEERARALKARGIDEKELNSAVEQYRQSKREESRRWQVAERGLEASRSSLSLGRINIDEKLLTRLLEALPMDKAERYADALSEAQHESDPKIRVEKVDAVYRILNSRPEDMQAAIAGVRERTKKKEYAADLALSKAQLGQLAQLDGAAGFAAADGYSRDRGRVNDAAATLIEKARQGLEEAKAAKQSGNDKLALKKTMEARRNIGGATAILGSSGKTMDEEAATAYSSALSQTKDWKVWDRGKIISGVGTEKEDLQALAQQEADIRLLQQGWKKRADGSLEHVELTPEGRKLIDQAVAAVEALDSQLDSRLRRKSEWITYVSDADRKEAGYIARLKKRFSDYNEAAVMGVAASRPNVSQDQRRAMLERGEAIYQGAGTVTTGRIGISDSDTATMRYGNSMDMYREVGTGVKTFGKAVTMTALFMTAPITGGVTGHIAAAWIVAEGSHDSMDNYVRLGGWSGMSGREKLSWTASAAVTSAILLGHVAGIARGVMASSDAFAQNVVIAGEESAIAGGVLSKGTTLSAGEFSEVGRWGAATIIRPSQAASEFLEVRAWGGKMVKGANEIFGVSSRAEMIGSSSQLAIGLERVAQFTGGYVMTHGAIGAVRATATVIDAAQRGETSTVEAAAEIFSQFMMFAAPGQHLLRAGRPPAPTRLTMDSQIIFGLLTGRPIEYIPRSARTSAYRQSGVVALADAAQRIAHLAEPDAKLEVRQEHARQARVAAETAMLAERMLGGEKIDPNQHPTPIYEAAEKLSKNNAFAIATGRPMNIDAPAPTANRGMQVDLALRELGFKRAPAREARPAGAEIVPGPKVGVEFKAPEKLEDLKEKLPVDLLNKYGEQYNAVDGALGNQSIKSRNLMVLADQLMKSAGQLGNLGQQDAATSFTAKALEVVKEAAARNASERATTEGLGPKASEKAYVEAKRLSDAYGEYVRTGNASPEDLALFRQLDRLGNPVLVAREVASRALAHAKESVEAGPKAEEARPPEAGPREARPPGAKPAVREAVRLTAGEEAREVAPEVEHPEEVKKPEPLVNTQQASKATEKTGTEKIGESVVEAAGKKIESRSTFYSGEKIEDNGSANAERWNNEKIFDAIQDYLKRLNPDLDVIIFALDKSGLNDISIGFSNKLADALSKKLFSDAIKIATELLRAKGYVMADALLGNGNCDERGLVIAGDFKGREVVADVNEALKMAKDILMKGERSEHYESLRKADSQLASRVAKGLDIYAINVEGVDTTAGAYMRSRMAHPELSVAFTAKPSGVEKAGGAKRLHDMYADADKSSAPFAPVVARALGLEGHSSPVYDGHDLPGQELPVIGQGEKLPAGTAFGVRLHLTHEGNAQVEKALGEQIREIAGITPEKATNEAKKIMEEQKGKGEPVTQEQANLMAAYGINANEAMMLRNLAGATDNVEIISFSRIVTRKGRLFADNIQFSEGNTWLLHDVMNFLAQNVVDQFVPEIGAQRGGRSLGNMGYYAPGVDAKTATRMAEDIAKRLNTKFGDLHIEVRAEVTRVPVHEGEIGRNENSQMPTEIDARLFSKSVNDKIKLVARHDSNIEVTPEQLATIEKFVRQMRRGNPETIAQALGISGRLDKTNPAYMAIPEEIRFRIEEIREGRDLRRGRDTVDSVIFLSEVNSAGAVQRFFDFIDKNKENINDAARVPMPREVPGAEREMPAVRPPPPPPSIAVEQAVAAGAEARRREALAPEAGRPKPSLRLVPTPEAEEAKAPTAVSEEPVNKLISDTQAAGRKVLGLESQDPRGLLYDEFQRSLVRPIRPDIAAGPTEGVVEWIYRGQEPEATKIRNEINPKSFSEWLDTSQARDAAKQILTEKASREAARVWAMPPMKPADLGKRIARSDLYSYEKERLALQFNSTEMRAKATPTAVDNALVIFGEPTMIESINQARSDYAGLRLGIQDMLTSFGKALMDATRDRGFPKGVPVPVDGYYDSRTGMIVSWGTKEPVGLEKAYQRKFTITFDPQSGRISIDANTKRMNQHLEALDGMQVRKPERPTALAKEAAAKAAAPTVKEAEAKPTDQPRQGTKTYMIDGIPIELGPRDKVPSGAVLVSEGRPAQEQAAPAAPEPVGKQAPRTAEAPEMITVMLNDLPFKIRKGDPIPKGATVLQEEGAIQEQPQQVQPARARPERETFEQKMNREEKERQQLRDGVRGLLDKPSGARAEGLGPIADEARNDEIGKRVDELKSDKAYQLISEIPGVKDIIAMRLSLAGRSGTLPEIDEILVPVLKIGNNDVLVGIVGAIRDSAGQERKALENTLLNADPAVGKLLIDLASGAYPGKESLIIGYYRMASDLDTSILTASTRLAIEISKLPKDDRKAVLDALSKTKPFMAAQVSDALAFSDQRIDDNARKIIIEQLQKNYVPSSAEENTLAYRVATMEEGYRRKILGEAYDQMPAAEKARYRGGREDFIAFKEGIYASNADYSRTGEIILREGPGAVLDIANKAESEEAARRDGVFAKGIRDNIKAQGVETGKGGGIRALYNIMNRGIDRGNEGSLKDVGNPDTIAGPHGPYYVTYEGEGNFVPNSSNPKGMKPQIPFDQHTAYVVPSEFQRRQIAAMLALDVSAGRMDAGDAAARLAKVVTYEEYGKSSPSEFTNAKATLERRSDIGTRLLTEALEDVNTARTIAKQVKDGNAPTEVLSGLRNARERLGKQSIDEFGLALQYVIDERINKPSPPEGPGPKGGPKGRGPGPRGEEPVGKEQGGATITQIGLRGARAQAPEEIARAAATATEVNTGFDLRKRADAKLFVQSVSAQDLDRLASMDPNVQDKLDSYRSVKTSRRLDALTDAIVKSSVERRILIEKQVQEGAMEGTTGRPQMITTYRVVAQEGTRTAEEVVSGEVSQGPGGREPGPRGEGPRGMERGAEVTPSQQELSISDTAKRETSGVLDEISQGRITIAEGKQKLERLAERVRANRSLDETVREDIAYGLESLLKTPNIESRMKVWTLAERQAVAEAISRGNVFPLVSSLVEDRAFSNVRELIGLIEEIDSLEKRHSGSRSEPERNAISDELTRKRERLEEIKSRLTPEATGMSKLRLSALSPMVDNFIKSQDPKNLKQLGISEKDAPTYRKNAAAQLLELVKISELSEKAAQEYRASRYGANQFLDGKYGGEKEQGLSTVSGLDIDAVPKGLNLETARAKATQAYENNYESGHRNALGAAVKAIGVEFEYSPDFFQDLAKGLRAVGDDVYKIESRGKEQHEMVCQMILSGQLMRDVRKVTGNQDIGIVKIEPVKGGGSGLLRITLDDGTAVFLGIGTGSAASFGSESARAQGMIPPEIFDKESNGARNHVKIRLGDATLDSEYFLMKDCHGFSGRRVDNVIIPGGKTASVDVLGVAMLYDEVLNASKQNDPSIPQSTRFAISEYDRILSERPEEVMEAWVTYLLRCREILLSDRQMRNTSVFIVKDSETGKTHVTFQPIDMDPVGFRIEGYPRMGKAAVFEQDFLVANKSFLKAMAKATGKSEAEVSNLMGKAIERVKANRENGLDARKQEIRVIEKNHVDSGGLIGMGRGAHATDLPGSMTEILGRRSVTSDPFGRIIMDSGIRNRMQTIRDELLSSEVRFLETLQTP